MGSGRFSCERARRRCAVSAKAKFGELLLLLLLLSCGVDLTAGFLKTESRTRTVRAQLQTSNMVDVAAGDLFCCPVCK